MTRIRTVYIVSDLHLGGDPGFRMMTQPERLAGLVERIAAADPRDEKRELVINGDFVDFLAEVDAWDADRKPHWIPFIEDPGRAVERFRKIAGSIEGERSMDAPVFDALASLLERGHRLTVLPGNHDVELCLPAVRQALLERLRYRPGYDLHVQHDGEGYVIGNALVEHGNRYDAANFVDHERLHNLRVKQTLRQDLPGQLPFAPPFGSVFVAKVMNAIKLSHPFVDLLKPEGTGLVAMLLAIDPGLRDALRDLAKAVVEHRRRHAQAKEAWEEQTVFRGGSRGAAPQASPAEPAMRGPVEPEVRGDGPRGRGPVEPADRGFEGPRGLRSAVHASPDDELAAIVEEAFGPLPEAQPELHTAHEAVRGPVVRGRLAAAWSAFKAGGGPVVQLLVGGGRIKEVRRIELLRKALRQMGTSPEFARDREDPNSPYLAAARALARSNEHPDGFDYVIFGHTHHAKDIVLDGGARYLNSGTWANLMSFPEALFDPSVDEAEAEAVLDAFVADLKHGKLEPHILAEPTYVELALDEHGQVEAASVQDG